MLSKALLKIEGGGALSKRYADYIFPEALYRPVEERSEADIIAHMREKIRKVNDKEKNDESV